MPFIEDRITKSRAWTDDSPLGVAPPSAVVARWFVEAPWAHPIWKQYWITLVHLRAEDGLPPPHLYDPQATHEIQIWALHPETPVAPGEAGSLTPGMLLSPQNFVGQARFYGDEDAAARLKSLVDAITQGRLSPDTDFRSRWCALFPFHPY